MAISNCPQADTRSKGEIKNLVSAMNRTPGLAVSYILRPVTAAPSQDTEEHRPAPLNAALNKQHLPRFPPNTIKNPLLRFKQEI